MAEPSKSSERARDSSGRALDAALLAVVGALAMALLVLPNLDAIPHPYWDEGFYLTDARRFFRPDALLTNPEHPPLGKWLMGLSVWLGRGLWGDAPWGYRLPSALATVALVALVPWALHVARLVPRGAPRWLGLVPIALLVLDPMLTVMGRIATLDALLDLVYALAVTALLVGVQAEGATRRRAWLASGVCAGLALGIKLTAVTLVPLFFIAALVDRGVRETARGTRRELGVDGPGLAQLLVPMVLAYVACWALPNALRFDPHAFHASMGPIDPDAPFLERLVGVHTRMVGWHTSYFAGHWHSSALEWVAGRSPIWFAAEPAESAGLRVVIALGTPLWIVSALGVLACGGVGLRRGDRARMLLAAVPLVQVGFWLVAPRMTLLYYTSNFAFAAALACFVALGDAFARLREAQTLMASAVCFVALALGAAWLGYAWPVITGVPLDEASLRGRVDGSFASYFVHPAYPADELITLGRRGEYAGARAEP